jgi:hypothetical protein
MKFSDLIFGAMTILSFIFALFPSTLEEVRKVDPYRLIAFCVFAVCIFYWGYSAIQRFGLLGGVLQKKRGVKVIRNPQGYQYLIEGNSCCHIPDPPTFHYLGGLFGFTPADSKVMESEEIKRKFTIGKQLPSITVYFPKAEEKSKRDV